MDETLFQWDTDKNQSNITKHGISFETAVRVFDDTNSIIIYDTEHSSEEDRFNIIGMVDEVLFVVYTERKEFIRIISARLATEEERSLYYDRNIYI